MKKKALSLALALVMCLGLTVPASARVEGLWIYADSSSDYYTCITLDHKVEGTAVQGYVENNVEALTKYTVTEGDMIGVNSPFYESGTLCLYGMELNEAGIYQRNGKEKLLDYGDYVLDSDFVGCWTPHDKIILEVLPTTQPQPSVKTANPSNDKLTVNGVEGTPTVYNIDNSNYFKIRDVAALLNGTEKQFSVGYDAEKQSVTATTGQGYDKLPADLAGAPAGAGEAKASGDAIYVNGTKITPTVYNINGNNYFKLRDLGEALDFYIGWTLERGVYIETDKPYAK